MTEFTKAHLERGIALHADLKALLQERIVGKDFEAKQAHRDKTDDLSLFWWSHGEAALAALEKAWELLIEYWHVRLSYSLQDRMRKYVEEIIGEGSLRAWDADRFIFKAEDRVRLCGRLFPSLPPLRTLGTVITSGPPLVEVRFDEPGGGGARAFYCRPEVLELVKSRCD